MGKLYLISGMPGAGKTTFARFLAQKEHISMFCKDSIKEILFDTVGYRSSAEKDNLDLAAFEILLYIAEKGLLNGDVILESNFAKFEENDIIRLVERTHSFPITILMDGDFDTIYERMAQRDREPDNGRHPAHKIPERYPLEPGENPPMAPMMSREVFLSLVREKGFRDFAVGPLLRVDVTDFETVKNGEIYDRLQKIIGDSEGNDNE